MFTLQQLFATDSDDVTSPAPEKGWLDSDFTNAGHQSPYPKLVGVAVIEGKRKEDRGFGFETRKADPLCVNASNPYHQCADYCAKRSPGAKMLKGVNSVVSVVVSVENSVKDFGARKVDPRCVNASNPYHVCADYCVERMRETDSPRRRKSDSCSPKDNGKLMTVERKEVNPNCVNASNLYHKCAEYCLDKARVTDSPRETNSVSSSPKSEGKLNIVERKDVNPNCVNASNPYHKCAEYCLENARARDSPQETKSVSSLPKSVGTLNVVERKHVNPNCVNASNPYHKCAEYCLENENLLEIDSPQARKSVSSLPTSEGKLNVMEGKDVNPNCVNASNPYHKCAEYCIERMHEMDRQQGRKSVSSSPKSKGKLDMVDRKDVDPNCANASNPYHKCGEYCLEKKQEGDSQRGRMSVSSLKSKGKVNLVERKDVDPSCVNASNPYHKCAEYCFKREQEISNQQRKKSGSSPKSEEKLDMVERKDVDPNCVNASNPYHKCAEYCLERKQTMDSQQRRKSVSSSPKSKGMLDMVERKDVDPNCVHASNPYHKCAEYCLERMQETDNSRGRESVSSSPKGKGKLIVVERKDVDPNCVNASHPYHKCAECCYQRTGAAA